MPAVPDCKDVPKIRKNTPRRVPNGRINGCNFSILSRSYKVAKTDTVWHTGFEGLLPVRLLRIKPHISDRQNGPPRLAYVRRREAGWTLMELLIVIAIIAILALIILGINWQKSLFRANDSRRKTDVANIRRSFEEYYNDHECYPDLTVLDTCGGNALSPYLDRIPCDPTTGDPYLYEPDSDVNLCRGNRVCTMLQDVHDPDIIALGCDPVEGCGWGAGWNYCLATGTTVTAPGFVPGVSATPIPTVTPTYEGTYACRPGVLSGGAVVVDGTCNNVGNPSSYGCPWSWAEADCQNNCGNSSYWCAL